MGFVFYGKIPLRMRYAFMLMGIMTLIVFIGALVALSQ